MNQNLVKYTKLDRLGGLPYSLVSSATLARHSGDVRTIPLLGIPSSIFTSIDLNVEHGMNL